MLQCLGPIEHASLIHSREVSPTLPPHRFMGGDFNGTLNPNRTCGSHWRDVDLDAQFIHRGSVPSSKFSDEDLHQSINNQPTHIL